jgi:cold shock CspA family protein
MSMTGRIVRFPCAGQYGIIEPDDGSADVSFSTDDAPCDIAPGTPVRFSSLQGCRSLKAYNIMILRSEADRSTHARSAQSVGTLSRRSYEDEIMAVLTSRVPDITGAQLAEVRALLTDYAIHRGWLRLDEVTDYDAGSAAVLNALVQVTTGTHLEKESR